MLTNLYIENIAVIEKSNIDFSNGFNVITGETGAGKSIIIGAINAILGRRISKDIIRTGAESAFVSATFDNLPCYIIQKIREEGYPIESDGTLIIKREINVNGKNVCRINDRPATVSTLKEIGSSLINIHGQHENYGLLSVQSHISYIDKIGDLYGPLSDYKKVYNELLNVRNEIESMLINDMEKERKLDLLTYQTEEIKSANLRLGEFEELNELRNKYLNSEKIGEAINNAKYLLDGKDDSLGAITKIEKAISSLEGITEYLLNAKVIKDRIQNAFYEIEDCSMELSGNLEGICYDKKDLLETEERLDCIYKLKRKYGSDIGEILEYLEKSEKELSKIENSDIEIQKLRKKQEALEKESSELSSELSEKRKVFAKLFSKKVKEELAYLDMPGVNIDVHIENCAKYSLGQDKVEFLISTNAGEEAKSLSKIASGGELSRIMLSIKNVLSSSDEVDTMIFDEVDTGISGSAAQKVGLKLKEVSKNRQVICVTHLAQIAALGDHHILIKKITEHERTYTKIQNLDQEGRKHEIARIISGISITESTLKNAKEMIEMARNI